MDPEVPHQSTRQGSRACLHSGSGLTLITINICHSDALTAAGAPDAKGPKDTHVLRLTGRMACADQHPGCPAR